MKKAGVIGGGAWGTALAQVCARAGLETTLWAREPDVVASVNTSHENTSFLAGVELEPMIRATGLSDACAKPFCAPSSPSRPKESSTCTTAMRVMPSVFRCSIAFSASRW